MSASPISMYKSSPARYLSRWRRRRTPTAMISSSSQPTTRAAARAAHRISRSCRCPVWLLRPGFTGSRVLVAVDPDHGIEHNRLTIELARSQAELHDGELHVMHAWDLPHLDLVGSDSDIGSRELAAVADAVEATHRGYFDDLVSSMGLAPGPGIHLVNGPAGRAIKALAVLYRADLIVVGAGAWSEGHLGLGSTTEEILIDADCSVLVVRPPAVSP